ncbi:Uncharacterised protein [Ectopseudomonas mendocina]|uniref:Uncharacterized protein n=1 Tax=Ectopseudomonas mendocina TaxID=300 RepID=A0A379PLB0_ECTME|nr:hypothetical protein [Pseudomonas mendocina]SUE95760.1 Uncharacterised protein [Pseudomonas mendocina]
MSEETPDRIKAKLTIDIDFAKEDQPLIMEVLQNILDNLPISSSGNGSRTKHSHYSYKLETNQPSQPMTMERLFDIMDQAREPGEPSMGERMAESMRSDYEQIEQWWDKLNDLQKAWFRENYKGITLISQAYDIYQKYEPQEKAVFDRL